jgi:hypothetical protein
MKQRVSVALLCFVAACSVAISVLAVRESAADDKLRKSAFAVAIGCKADMLFQGSHTNL